MLGRLIEAAGQDVVIELAPRGDRLTLAELATAFDLDLGRPRIDWTRFRGFVDWVEQHPDLLSSAIADPPASELPLPNTILAALAEQLAVEYNIGIPRWVRAFGPLKEP